MVGVASLVTVVSVVGVGVATLVGVASVVGVVSIGVTSILAAARLTPAP